MCLINVAHEHFITQAGKKSKPALQNFMRPEGRGPRADMWGLGPRSEKNKYPLPHSPKQANLKSKLPRGGETDILHWNIVCNSIFSQK